MKKSIFTLIALLAAAQSVSAAIVHADRVRETSATTGTGTYSLLGPAIGFRSFVSGVGTANQCYYTAEDGVNWETGVGTVTAGSPNTLSRDVVLASSNSGNAVNWSIGVRRIFCAPLGAAVHLAQNASRFGVK